MRIFKASNSGLVVSCPPSLKYMCKSLLLTYKAKTLQNKSIAKFKPSTLIRKSTNNVLFLSHFFPLLWHFTLVTLYWIYSDDTLYWIYTEFTLSSSEILTIVLGVSLQFWLCLKWITSFPILIFNSSFWKSC